MAQNDLLNTPLNDPNQEIKLAESSLKARDTAVQPATRNYFQEAMDIEQGVVRDPQPTLDSSVDLLNEPVSKYQKMMAARAEKQLRLIGRGADYEQDRLLNKDAFIQDVDNPLKYTANLALTGASGITDLVTGIGQVLPSESIDQEAESRHLAEPLAREKELQSLIEQTADPIASSNSIAELEGITSLLNAPYDSEMLAQREAAQAAVDAAPEGSWQEKANLAEIDYGLSLAPTNRDFRERAEGNVGGAVLAYDFLENVSKDVSSTVNRSSERKVQQEVEPYAAEAAVLWQGGDVVGSVGTIADGIFTVALANPGGALQMFVGSLPQMMAMVNPVTAAPTVISAYNQHVDTMMANYEEINGERATGEDKEFITIGGASAVMFDFFSDKIAMKGLDLIPVKMIQKATAKLGDVAPKGLKTVTEYTTNIAGRVGGLALQPIQEFVSGAGTELSEQAGVAGGFDGLDTGKIIEQGMIESIALAPVQGVVAAKDLLTSGKALVAKASSKTSDIGSVLSDQAELATTILQSTVTDPEDSTATADTAETTPVKQFIQFTANNSFKDLSLEEKTLEKTEEYMNQFNELFEAATDFHEKNPGVANEIELNYLKHAQATNQAAGALYTELTKADTDTAGTALRDVAAKLAKATAQDLSDPAKIVEFKDTFLGSIDLRNVVKDDSPTAAELKVAKETLKLTVAESVEVDAYIQLREAFEDVSTEIQSADVDNMGIAFHINEVVRAVNSKNIKAAEGALEFYAKWVAFQGFKVTKFNEIKAHNKLPLEQRLEAEVPVGVTAIDGVTRNGSVNRFTINYDSFAFDRHDKTKVQEWFFNDEKGATSKLIEVMKADQVALESALSALETLVAGGADTTNSNTTTPTEAAPETTTPPVETVQYTIQTPGLGAVKPGTPISRLSDTQLPKVIVKLEEKVNKFTGDTTESEYANLVADIDAAKVALGEQTTQAPAVPAVSVDNQAEIDIQVNAFNESQKETQEQPVVEEVATYNPTEELFGNAELDLNHVGLTVDGGVPAKAAFVENENGEQVDLQGGNALADNFNPKGTAAKANAEPEVAEEVPATPASEEVDFNNLLDDALEQINSNAKSVQDSTTPDVVKGSYLKKIRNFFGSINENLASLNLSEKEVEVLNELARLNNKLTNNLSTVIEALKDPSKPLTVTSKYAVNGTKDTLMQNPMLMLAKAITVGSKAKRAYFDPNIVSMMNLAGINWIATQGTGTLYNDADSIKRILRAESKAPNAELSTLAKLSLAGTMYTTLVESLGKEIYKQLSLELKENTPALLKDRLIVSLGETAVENLISAGLLEKNEFIAEDLFTDGGKAKVFFVRIPTKGKNSIEPADRVSSILALNKGKNSAAYISLAKKITGTEIRAKFPSLKAKVLKESATYLKSLRLLPKRVRDDINIANAVKWKIKPDMEYLLQPENREEATEFFMLMQGYEPNVQDRPLVLQAGDIGRNLGIMNEIEGAFDFYDVYVENGKKGFNFSYNTGENARHTVNESGFSYQSSKLVRHIITAENSKQKKDGFRVTVPLNLKESLILDNFKYAVVQALSSEVSIDKDIHETILKEFDNLASDPIINIASKMVFDKKYLDRSVVDVTDVLREGNRGAHGLDGLTALGNYFNALENEQTQFSTDITIETDAITSGVMLTLLNFGATDTNSIEKLNSGGIFLDSHNTVSEHRRTKKNDVYTMLVDPWKERAALFAVKASRYAEILNLVEIDRNTAKPIIMQGSYMADYSSLVNNFIRGTSDGQINALYQRLYEGTTAQKIAIYNSLGTLVYPKNKDSARELSNSLYADDGLLNTQELPAIVIDKYTSGLHAIYGDSLIEILKEDEGMRPNATAMNQMVNMVSWYYRFKIDKAIEALGGYENLTEEGLLAVYADPALADLVPYLPTPDSIAREEGLNGLITRNFRDSSNDSNVVKQELNPSKEGGARTASARSSRKVPENASARSFVISVQSIDDAVIRAVMRQMKVMSAFDAIYASLGTINEGAKIYNENVFEISKSFSIFEETHNNYTKSMSALKKSGEFNELIQFMFDDTNGFNPRNQLVEKYLYDPSQPQSGNLSDISDPTNADSLVVARNVFTKMQKDLKEKNETVKRNRRELFRRIRTIDHMGMPGTHVNVNNDIGEQGNLPGVDAATEEQKATVNKKPTKKEANKLPQSLFGYIAKLGGITRKDVEWLDKEIVTAGGQAGNKNVFVKNGLTLSQVREDTLGVYHNIADDNEFSEYLKTELDINSSMPGSTFDLTYPLDSLEEVQVLKDAAIDAEYVFEQEQERQLQVEEDRTTFLNENQDSTLGSISNNDDLTGYTPLAGGLRANSLQQVFDTIGGNSSSGVNSTSHINHLSGILKRVVSQVMVPADKLELYVRTQGDTSYGKQVGNKVYINIGASLPKNLVSPSAKESYVHELVHVVTRAALSDPKSNSIVRKLSKIMDETVVALNKKYSGEAWKVFLKRDAQGNPIYAVSQLEEEKAAKEAFDYIFNNSMMAETTTYDADSKKGQVVQTRAGLHEFLAYALTNESLNSALSDDKISVYNPVKDANNIFAKLLAILENVLTWAEDTLNKARQKTGNDKANNTAELLEQMVHELTVTTDAYQIRSGRIMEALTNLNTRTSALARAKVGVPFAEKAEKARYKALSLGNRFTYISLTYAGFINPVTRDKLRNELDNIRASMRISKRNFITELYREIAGNITTDQRTAERMLLDSRQSLDAQRDEYTNAIANSISQGYTGKLSNEESEATTRVLIESDFTVLVDDWANVDLLDLAAYLTDTAKRDKAIKDVRNQLAQYGQIGGYYIGQALSLGSFMAQGFVTVEGTRLNASLIARADDLSDLRNIKVPKELEQVEALVERLATLQAINLNTKDSRDTAAAVMVREHGVDIEKNGAINMLVLIDEHKKQSLLRNFENNKTLQMKGYSKEVSDPNISIQVASLDEEQAYAAMGYKLVDRTFTDTDDTGAPTVMGIYQNRTGGHATRQKFIMSVTNTQMQGQSILKRASTEGGKEAYAEAQKKVSDIKAKNKLEARKLLRNPDYVSPKKNILIPVTDGLGNVTDYRYVMGKAKKSRLLNQKAGVEMILSKMYGAIIDKEETPRINNDVIKELHNQYISSAGRQTRDFVEISLNAVDERGQPNAEYREIYQILPDSTKRYIKKLTGDDKIMVRAEFVDIMFGRKKLKLPGNDTMQQIYGSWFEFVAGAKKNIVIKWPATLIGNVLSNTAFGVMYGVPVEFMFKKQAEGAIKLNNYVQDIKQLNNLKLELVVAKRTNAASDIKSIEAKIAKVQTNINTSPILPLIKGGAFQTIVEDVDVLKDPYGYGTKISDFFGEIQGRGGKGGASVGGARQVYKYAYMSDDTAVFKALMKTTQFSDFAARYAKYEYMTKFQKMDEVAAMETVMEDFVNYETPTNKYVQFANDSGLQMFTKYGFRILRVIASLMQGRPLNAVAFLLINDALTSDIPSPFDVTPFDNSNGLVSLVMAGTTPSGIKLVEDAADMVTSN